MTESLEQPGTAITWEGLFGSGPRGQLLGSADHSVTLTAAGTGFSQSRELLLTRWDGDPVQDAQGLFFYLRDLDGGQVWSAGHQPIQARPDRYEATFGDGVAVISREDHGISSTLEVAVVPGRRAELRRLTLRNIGGAARRIEVTSCLEAVLNERGADLAHPGFSKLFLQTEWKAGERTLLARRRPRGAQERPLWMYHWICPDQPGPLEFESDRSRFLGRGRSLRNPRALEDRSPLSGTDGSVLDPVMVLRCVLTIPAGGSRVVSFGLGCADQGEDALAVSRSLSDPSSVERAFQAAVREAREGREALGLSAAQARNLDQVAVELRYNRVAPMAPEAPLEPGGLLPRVKGPAEGPFILAPGAQAEGLNRLAQARTYWQSRGFFPKILVLGAAGSLPGPASLWEGPEACVFQSESTLTAAERAALLRRATRVAGDGFLQPLAGGTGIPAAGRCNPLRAGRVDLPETEPLLEDNGWGGFSQDGREYVIRIRPGAAGTPELPPMPWANVIANEKFGFLVTERGPGATWGSNSRLHRVTPWFNDPIADPLPEAFYLRDEESLEFWSPTPGPVDAGLACRVRHGFGYTTWETPAPGLEQEVTTFAVREEPVKLTRIRIRNTGSVRRRLSLFWYAQLALGESTAISSPWLAVGREQDALLAWNLLEGPLSGQVAFARLLAGKAQAAFTTSRSAFLGTFGSLSRPRALTDGEMLDGCLEPGQDPCFALQALLELEPGECRECVVVMGEGEDAAQARRLLARYQDASAAEGILAEVKAFWQDTLGRVRMESPEPALDLMVNGWLPYQNLSCRMWARTAYYQSGGAFGFRDQLQDAASLIYVLPSLTRAQILRNASHQFVEGDVLHWWHPPIEQGIRTRFSDDLLWLPFITAFYLESTGDWKLLDEQAPYLTARLLEPGEDEAYLSPADSGRRGDVYEHCCKALDRSLDRFGIHGLPLMGTGDWNDGMNRVGREGHGESVWMGFFLYAILDGFLPVCARRGDEPRAARFRQRMASLAEALETAGWDGRWYRRAYYDDGTPLGSAQNEECRIDCLAQAWAVISRAVPEARARQAMAALEEHLVDEEAGLIRLLTPAFDTCDHDPGYIKGYLPGVRENGGQYTHGALWGIKAVAQQGDITRAAALLAMLSPVTHGRSRESVAVYQTEPYVIAADLYGVAPHVGRGGWTWYTGSAGWMYRVALEDVLGLRMEGGDALRFRPQLPQGWDRLRLDYRTEDGLASCSLRVERAAAGEGDSALLDGAALAFEEGSLRVPLFRDRQPRILQVKIGGGR